MLSLWLLVGVLQRRRFGPPWKQASLRLIDGFFLEALTYLRSRGKVGWFGLCLKLDSVQASQVDEKGSCEWGVCGMKDIRILGETRETVSMHWRWRLDDAGLRERYLARERSKVQHHKLHHRNEIPGRWHMSVPYDDS